MNPWWLAAALAAGAGVLLLRRKQPATTKPPSRALLIGDSLAVGLAAPLAKELAPAELVTRAHVGSRSSDWAFEGKYRGELEDALTKFRPDAVLVSLGTNDLAGGKPTATSFDFLAKRVAAKGAAVIFLGPPELPWPRGEVWSSAEAAGILVKAPEGLPHAPDGVHLTPAGYAAWAKFVGARLRAGVSGVGGVYDW